MGYSKRMIVITGAAGFIGSFLSKELYQYGNTQLILVDNFDSKEKENNHSLIKTSIKIDRNDFHSWFDVNHSKVSFVFHLGARTDTTEFDIPLLTELNLNYSKLVWQNCVKYEIPLVYASSAATYGDGEFGYDDSHELVFNLKPLNPYGDSKNEFDKWVLNQPNTPPFWAGLKFFNVYGPHESHKKRMASVVFHAYNQIKNTKKMKLFKSHNPKFKDGEQLRDFVYVKDVTSVCEFLLKNRIESGIYNLGSGKARTFKDLVLATFTSMGISPYIEFVDTPIDIRDKYQYYTQAEMEKLIGQGYTKRFYELEEGIDDYIKNYLSNS